MAAATSEQDIVGSIQKQLEGLRKTPDGLMLFRLIERGLNKRVGNYNGDTDRAFIQFLYTLLGRYAANTGGDTVTRVKVRLLQQRLTPHLLDDEVEAAADEEPPQQAIVDPEDTAGGRIEESMNRKMPADDVPDDVENLRAMELEAPEPVVNSLDKEVGESKTDVAAKEELSVGPMPDNEDRPDIIVGEEVTMPLPDNWEITADDTWQREQKDAGNQPPAAEEDSSVTTVELKDEPTVMPDVSLSPSPSPAPASRNDFTEWQDVPAKRVGNDLIPPPEPPIDDGMPDIIVGEAAKPVRPAPLPPAAPEEAEDILQPAGLLKEAKESSKEFNDTPGTNGVTGSKASRERVDKLHDTFVSKLAESLTRSKEYHTLLKSNLKALTLADTGADFMDLKYLLVRGMEDLIKGNAALGRDLGATSHYLKISQLDRALLKNELGRIHDNSFTDALTGLQNRTAFMRQLEAEIGRSKRYGFSLAVCIIDIDRLNRVNEEFGRGAGDEVLCCYAREILSQFRGYDLVSRISGNQFAVLFPNTQKEGALRALEKAQKRAAGVVIQHNGKSIGLPTFTSVLTLYTPGDRPEGVMKRTNDALNIVKKNGGDQVVVALPTS